MFLDEVFPHDPLACENEEMKCRRKTIARYRRSLTVALSLLVAVCNAHAEVGSTATDTQLYLPSLFSDDMVLQRGQPITVWGRAEPGMQITVILNDRRTVTTTNDKGQWESRLPAMPEILPKVVDG